MIRFLIFSLLILARFAIKTLKYLGAWMMGRPLPSVLPESGPAKPFVTIVLLLAEHRPLTTETLMPVLRRASETLHPDQPIEPKVMDIPGSYIALISDKQAMIISAPWAYGARPFAGDPSAPELIDLWKRHSAWLSVDALGSKSQKDEAEYPFLSRVAAEFLNSEVLAIYLPQFQRIIPNQPVLKNRLQTLSHIQDLLAKASE